jgi:DNA-binding PadR family transcriptional regulator
MAAIMGQAAERNKSRKGQFFKGTIAVRSTLLRVNGSPVKEPDNGPMRFSFSWPLLGLVIERPSYGFELTHRFERIYGQALALSSGKRIYESLEELSDRGLIERMQVETGRTTSRATKTYYEATDKGLAAYESWLIGQLEDERRRARVFARQLSMLPSQEALEVLDRHESECLEEVASTEEREPGAAPGGAEAVVERLTYEHERLTLGINLSWFDFIRRELLALSKGELAEADEPDEDASGLHPEP